MPKYAYIKTEVTNESHIIIFSLFITEFDLFYAFRSLYAADPHQT